jgi:hypothetical protein
VIATHSFLVVLSKIGYLQLRKQLADQKSVGTAFTSVNTKSRAMEGQDKKRNEPGVPDTTQKKEGTTSAFSAASTAGEQENLSNERKKYLEDGEQGRASFVAGSTSQGGSNFGQGSSYLGPSSYKQGAEKGKGANYENEQGRFAETGIQCSGYSASTEDVSYDPRKQGGTDAEHDEIGEREDTAGIP